MATVQTINAERRFAGHLVPRAGLWAENEFKDVCCLRAQRKSDTDLAGLLPGDIRNQTVDTAAAATVTH